MFDYTTNSSTKESKEEEKKKRRVCNTFPPYAIVMQAHRIPLVVVQGSLSLFFCTVREGEMKNDACVHVTGGLSKMAVGSRADGLIGTVIKHAEMCSNVRTVTKLRRHSFLLKDEAPPKLA